MSFSKENNRYKNFVTLTILIGIALFFMALVPESDPNCQSESSFAGLMSFAVLIITNTWLGYLLGKRGKRFEGGKNLD